MTNLLKMDKLPSLSLSLGCSQSKKDCGHSQSIFFPLPFVIPRINLLNNSPAKIEKV